MSGHSSFSPFVRLSVHYVGSSTGRQARLLTFSGTPLLPIDLLTGDPNERTLGGMSATTARPLDRDTPLPLWAQLETDLRRRLGEGEFADRFPTDHELVEQYAVSRHTVREAVRRLLAEGVVRRERGRGSFVDQTGVEQPLGALYSLIRTVEAQGLTQHSEVLALDTRRDAEIAATLGEPADAELVFLARVRHAGDEPLAVDRVWLPDSLAAPLLAADFTRTALYDELAARCGVHLVGGTERIQPAHPPAEDASHLAITPTTPVFSVERTGRTSDRLVERRHTIIRGDRYVFTADWGSHNDHGLRAAPTTPPPVRGTPPS